MSVEAIQPSLYDIYTGGQEERCCLEKVIGCIVAFVREIFYALSRVFFMLVPSSKIEEAEWKQEGKGFFVLIHGLYSSPGSFRCQLDNIGSDYDVLAPEIPNEGSLEELADPSYNKVKEYCQKFPGRKVCLIGHSNGARIVDYIETKMREEFPDTPVYVSTINGAHLGSPLQGLASWWGVSTTLLDELAYQSDKVKEIMEKVKAPLAEGVQRKFEFYASLDDFIVPVSSAMPAIDKGEVQRLTTGVGHTYMVEWAAEEQIRNAKEWFSS